MDLAGLQQLLQRVAGARVVAVGDLMVDRFVYGEVARISAEAPIPVMARTRESVMLGAAGNVARNVAALGGEVALVGVIGKDGGGKRSQGPDRGRVAHRGLPDHRSRAADHHQDPLRLRRPAAAAGRRGNHAAGGRRGRAATGAHHHRRGARRRRDPDLRLRQGRRHRGGDRGRPRRRRARGRGADRRFQGPLVRPLRRGRRHQAERRRARLRHRPADRDRRRDRGGAGARAGALRVQGGAGDALGQGHVAGACAASRCATSAARRPRCSTPPAPATRRWPRSASALSADAPLEEAIEFALLAAGVAVQKAGTATASPDEMIEAEISERVAPGRGQDRHARADGPRGGALARAGPEGRLHQRLLRHPAPRPHRLPGPGAGVVRPADRRPQHRPLGAGAEGRGPAGERPGVPRPGAGRAALGRPGGAVRRGDAARPDRGGAARRADQGRRLQPRRRRRPRAGGRAGAARCGSPTSSRATPPAPPSRSSPSGHEPPGRLRHRRRRVHRLQRRRRGSADDRGLDVVVCDWLGEAAAGKWRNLAKHPIADFVPPEQMFEWLETQRRATSSWSSTWARSPRPPSPTPT